MQHALQRIITQALIRTIFAAQLAACRNWRAGDTHRRCRQSRPTHHQASSAPSTSACDRENQAATETRT